MKSVTSKNECDCPNDCRSYAYSVTVASAFLNEKIYCPKDAGLLKDFQGPLGLPKMFFSYYKASRILLGIPVQHLLARLKKRNY